MKNILMSRIIQRLSLPLLLMCVSCATLQAQCNVYFSYCPDKITIVDCDGDGFETLNWDTPIAATTGGCTNFSMVQIAGPAQGTIVPVPSVHTIKYHAGATDIGTDKKVKASCTFTVEVIEDNQPPVFTFCPPDITLYTGTDMTVNAFWTNPIVEDDCGTVKVKTNIPCGTPLGVGVHFVSYKAVDGSGNAMYCNFTVTILPGYPKPARSREEQTDGSTELTAAFNLTPNPVKDNAVLYADTELLPKDQVLRVSIYSIHGKLLEEMDWSLRLVPFLNIDATSIPQGLFVIKIYGSDGAFYSALRGIKL